MPIARNRPKRLIRSYGNEPDAKNLAILHVASRNYRTPVERAGIAVPHEIAKGVENDAAVIDLHWHENVRMMAKHHFGTGVYAASSQLVLILDHSIVTLRDAPMD